MASETLDLERVKANIADAHTRYLRPLASPEVIFGEVVGIALVLSAEVERLRGENERLKRSGGVCTCHVGSVCGEACAKWRHHDGCYLNVDEIPERGGRVMEPLDLEAIKATFEKTKEAFGRAAKGSRLALEELQSLQAGLSAKIPAFLAEVERLRGENARLRERDADNEAIFEWLQGAASYRGDWFPEKPEGGKPYWWRSHLRKKLETRRG